MRKQTSGNWQHDRRSRHERGYGSEWAKLRKLVLQRDKHLCQISLRNGRIVPATEVDHIVPKFKGGTDDLDNLQAVSAEAHRIKTEREATEARGGRQRLGFDAAGWPVWPE